MNQKKFLLTVRYGPNNVEVDGKTLNLNAASLNYTKQIGFKENLGIQPYVFDNTEYDDRQKNQHQPMAPAMLPPIYKSIDNQLPAYAAQRGDQVCFYPQNQFYRTEFLTWAQLNYN